MRDTSWMSLVSELAHGAKTTGGRILLSAMLLGAVAIAVLALLPGRVNHATLSDSVASSVSDAVTRGLGYDADCRPADTAWRCVLTTTDASDSGVTYNVAISGNCWSAVLSNSAGMLGLPSRAKDCIHLVDQLTD